MMARCCDHCRCLIDQADDKFVELQVRVLETTQGVEQDPLASAYGDFCDACIVDGSALAKLFADVKWTLDGRRA